MSVRYNVSAPVRSPKNELDFGSDSSGSESSCYSSPSPYVNTNKQIVATKGKSESEIKKDLKQQQQNQQAFLNRQPTDLFFPNTKNYTFKSWRQFFPTSRVTLRSLVYNPAWDAFFDSIQHKKYYIGIEKILSDCMLVENIVPFPELLFNSLNILSPKNIKGVFIGQDPYIQINRINNKEIPQAMGSSFSVPLYYPKPPSLANIYKNLVEFGHMKNIPESGCLSMWILQGCLMINSALTTIQGNSAAHQNLWVDFTQDLLRYINDTCHNLFFVAWGSKAHGLCMNIDCDKHYIITSSHPSPMGMTYANPMKGLSYARNKAIKTNKNNRETQLQVTYDAFKNVDHFGKINSYLTSIGKKTILWDVI